MAPPNKSPKIKSDDSPSSPRIIPILGSPNRSAFTAPNESNQNFESPARTITSLASAPGTGLSQISRLTSDYSDYTGAQSDTVNLFQGQPLTRGNSDNTEIAEYAETASTDSREQIDYKGNRIRPSSRLSEKNVQKWSAADGELVSSSSEHSPISEEGKEIARQQAAADQATERRNARKAEEKKARNEVSKAAPEPQSQVDLLAHYPVKLNSVTENKNVNNVWSEDEEYQKKLMQTWVRPYDTDSNTYKDGDMNIFHDVVLIDLNEPEYFFSQDEIFKPIFDNDNYYDTDDGKEILDETLNILFDSHIDPDDSINDPDDTKTLIDFVDDEINVITDNLFEKLYEKNPFNITEDEDEFDFEKIVFDDISVDKFDFKDINHQDTTELLKISEYYEIEDGNVDKQKSDHIEEISDYIESKVITNVKQRVETDNRRSSRDRKPKIYYDELPEIKNLKKHTTNSAHRAVKNVSQEVVAKHNGLKKQGKGTIGSKQNTVLSASASTFMATINMNMTTINNNKKKYDRKSAKFIDYENMYSTATTAISNFIPNFVPSDLEATNRNSKLQALFYMLMGGKKDFVNFREDTARRVNNDMQMANVWGVKTTTYYQGGSKGGDGGYCYLCGGAITPKHFPEMEHKMPCTQFYSNIYNIVLYKNLLDLWKKFADKDGVHDLKILYTHLNHKFNKTNAEIKFNEIFNNFCNKYINSNITIITGDISRRELEIHDFKRLLLINLSEFSWSHHTCNQLKTNYYLPSHGDRFDKEMIQLIEYEWPSNTDLINMTKDERKQHIKVISGAVLSSKQVIHEVNNIKSYCKDKNNWSKRFNEVKEQIEYINNNINLYADTKGASRKRLFIRSIRRMMIEVPVGNKAAVIEMKRLQKTHKKVNELLAFNMIDFKNELDLHLSTCFPKSMRLKSTADVYMNKHVEFPLLGKLKEIVNLLYFAFNNVSPIEGLRLINCFFKHIHSTFIRDAIESCKSYNPFKSFTSECAKMKFCMNLLYCLRNNMLIDKNYNFKYDEFKLDPYKKYFNDHYQEIKKMLEETEYNPYTLNANDELEYAAEMETKTDPIAPMKELFGRIYNYYNSKTTSEFKGITKEEKEILDKAVTVGPESLLHIIGFTMSLKLDSTGRAKMIKGGKRRKTKKMRKRKTTKKNKKKGGKRKTLKRRKKNMRKTKYNK